MIGCDNDLCPIEWFHLNCVQLSCKPPRGKWYCPKCRGNKQTVKKPKAQFLKELAIFNKEREAKKAKSKKEVNNSKNTEEDNPKSEKKDEKNKTKPKKSKAKSKKEVNNSEIDPDEPTYCLCEQVRLHLSTYIKIVTPYLKWS